MAIRTITLKLHKPSRRKRDIIENAMRSYSSAYQYLLDRAFNEIENISKQYREEKGGYRANKLAKWIDKNISKDLNRFGVEPFKDSLKIDFGMTIAGYLNLREIQQSVRYPIAYVSETEWHQEAQKVLKDFEMGLKSFDECEKEIKRIIEKSSKFKPIFFCRYAVNRDYSLVYDSSCNRYYAKLYLLNVKSADRKIIKANDSKKLWHISKDNRVLENTGRKERYLLFPLSFGKWQEDYLKRAFERPEMFKTARLIKKKDEYYLAVNIEVEEAEKVKTNSFLGVARALSAPVHYCIIDNDMNIIDKAPIACSQTKRERGKDFCINDLHEIANVIVKIALQNKSQVIVESLIEKGDRLKWKESGRETHIPVLNCFSYNRLVDILEYKLKGEGLPPPIKVSPVKIFYTCPKCGLSSDANRFSKELFICTTCGFNTDIESLGSFNLAQKLYEYRAGALKVKIERVGKRCIRFKNDILDLDLYVDVSADYREEFINEINRIIREFYDNIGSCIRNSHFKKKYSLIKKIQEEGDILKLLRIDALK